MQGEKQDKTLNITPWIEEEHTRLSATSLDVMKSRGM